MTSTCQALLGVGRMVICISADGEEVHMRIKRINETPNHDTDEKVRPIRRMAASVAVLGLAFAGLAACSDATGDDPLPLSETDTGEIEVDPSVDDGVVEEDGVEEDGGG